MVIRVFLAVAFLATSVVGAHAATGLAPVANATDWLNGRPAELAGKVVLLDVFTFDCINCKHVIPELRTLYRTTSRSDLAIIGIHSPETPFERVRSNVISNLAAQGISWPVALDNNFSLWKAYGIEYWPTQLIFDRNGVLRKTVVGEGQDALLVSTVRELIAEKHRLSGMIHRISSRKYLVELRGAPGAAVRLRAEGLPARWIGAFCTAHICAPSSVGVILHNDGRTRMEFRIVPPDDRAAASVPFHIDVASASERITLGPY